MAKKHEDSEMLDFIAGAVTSMSWGELGKGRYGWTVNTISGKTSTGRFVRQALRAAVRSSKRAGGGG